MKRWATVFVVTSVSLIFGSIAYAAAIRGDFNSDGKLDRQDLALLISNYAKAGDSSKGELSGNNFVGIYDLSVFLSLLHSQGTNPGGQDPPVSSSVLRWKPPTLANPVVINVPAQSPNNLTTTSFMGDNKLDSTKDYIINFPITPIGSVGIEGGRNIVIKGMNIRPSTNKFTENGVVISGVSGTGLYINKVNGTVHIEGLFYDGGPTMETDGISVSNSPNATIQIQNSRVVNIKGTLNKHTEAEINAAKSQGIETGYVKWNNVATPYILKNGQRTIGYHGDVIQHFGGVKELRIDHMTGTTSYQGLFLRPDNGTTTGSADTPIDTIRISNTNMRYEKIGNPSPSAMLWFTGGQPLNVNGVAKAANKCASGRVVDLSNMYVIGAPGSTLGNYTVWPGTTAEVAACKGTVSGNTISWPSMNGIVTGHATEGSPPGGTDYAPANSFNTGAAYVSPGYQ